MADWAETILTDASAVASVIGWFVPGAAPIAKIIGYAAQAEPEAVKVWDMLVAHKATGATKLAPEHYEAIASAIVAVEARKPPQGRGGL